MSFRFYLSDKHLTKSLAVVRHRFAVQSLNHIVTFYGGL